MLILLIRNACFLKTESPPILTESNDCQIILAKCVPQMKSNVEANM